MEKKYLCLRRGYKMKKTAEVEILEDKKCKKCGEPIPSTSKYKKCDSCRRKSAEFKTHMLEGAIGLGVLALTIVPGVNKILKKK